MMALLLRQVFAEAETKKLALALDIGQVEDRELLDKVEKLSVSEWVDDATASRPSKRGGPAAVSPAKQHQLQVQQLQKDHDDELRQAKRTQERQQEDHARELKHLQRQLAEQQDKIDELTLQLEDSQRHVSQTKQFQSMKTMVAQKNAQLTALRRRLQRYEPDDDGDDGKHAEDDD
jgi:chromosome segregation ATPase